MTEEDEEEVMKEEDEEELSAAADRRLRQQCFLEEGEAVSCQISFKLQMSRTVHFTWS